MQLTAHARHIDTIPVVNAIGGVACLLDLGHHDAGAKCMDTTCWDEEDIVLLHLFVIQDTLQSIVLQNIGIIHPRHLAVETHDKFGILVGLYHIPHLGFAVA